MERRTWIIGLTLIVMLAAGAWVLGFFGGTDPAVAELQQMAQQAFDDNVPEAQRDQMRDQFRQRMGTLSDTQRAAFFEANRDQFTQRIEQRMNEFFAMSPADQQKRLDEIINRMTQPRENRTANSGGGNQGAGRADGRGDGRGRGDWGNMTEAQRDERSKRRLDQTSPKMRAQFSEFRKRLDQRAKERGIADLPGWGFPGGRRG